MAIQFLQGDVVTSPVSDFSVTDDLTVADDTAVGGDLTVAMTATITGDFAVMGAALNKLIETDASLDKMGLFGAAPVVQPVANTAALTLLTYTAPGTPDYALQDLVSANTGLTAALTTITHTAPGTPDYALQALVQNTGFGFVTANEGETVLNVIQNHETRITELQAASAFGFKTKDEGNTTLSVVKNLQTRVAELETKLKALGAMAT